MLDTTMRRDVIERRDDIYKNASDDTRALRSLFPSPIRDDAAEELISTATIPAAVVGLG
jgi:adenylate kinase